MEKVMRNLHNIRAIDWILSDMFINVFETQYNIDTIAKIRGLDSCNFKSFLCFSAPYTFCPPLSLPNEFRTPLFPRE